MNEVTDKMLVVAMKKAIELELFPNPVGQESYIKRWEGVKAIIEAAIKEYKK